MHINATVVEILPAKREVEVTAEGHTYKVRVPHWKLQDGFFNIGDSIPIKVVEQDQFALYDT
jgi:hypothetical protein